MFGTTGTSHIALSLNPSEYSYFSQDHMKMWAGPLHWKVKAKSKGENRWSFNNDISSCELCRWNGLKFERNTGKILVNGLGHLFIAMHHINFFTCVAFNFFAHNDLFLDTINIKLKSDSSFFRQNDFHDKRLKNVDKENTDSYWFWRRNRPEETLYHWKGRWSKRNMKNQNRSKV